MTCVLYGARVVKRVKTFLATHRTFGGAVRVVIVQEKGGPAFFYCTDTTASVAEILEAYADRAAIEQVFHDVKEVWGSGQQQVRNLWASIAAVVVAVLAYEARRLFGATAPSRRVLGVRGRATPDELDRIAGTGAGAAAAAARSAESAHGGERGEHSPGR